MRHADAPYAVQRTHGTPPRPRSERELHLAQRRRGRRVLLAHRGSDRGQIVLVRYHLHCCANRLPATGQPFYPFCRLGTVRGRSRLGGTTAGANLIPFRRLPASSCAEDFHICGAAGRQLSGQGRDRRRLHYPITHAAHPHPSSSSPGTSDASKRISGAPVGCPSRSQ